MKKKKLEKNEISKWKKIYKGKKTMKEISKKKTEVQQKNYLSITHLNDFFMTIENVFTEEDRVGCNDGK